ERCLRRLIECVRSMSSNTGLAECHEDFPVRTELEHLLTPSIFQPIVGYPEIASFVHGELVWANEQTGANVLEKLAGRRIKFKDRVDAGTGASRSPGSGDSTSVNYPDAAVRPNRDARRRSPFPPLGQL